MKTLIILSLLGCNVPNNSYVQPSNDDGMVVMEHREFDGAANVTSINIWHDNKRNVTCWQFNGYSYSALSISCITDNQLKLTEKKE